MNLFTSENEEVSWKICLSLSECQWQKLHYIHCKIFLLSSQVYKNESSCEMKINWHAACKNCNINQFLEYYSFPRYLQFKLHCKILLGISIVPRSQKSSCFRLDFDKDASTMMHLFIFPGNCLNSQQSSNYLKVLNIFNKKIQHVTQFLICEHNIPFTWGKLEFS